MEIKLLLDIRQRDEIRPLLARWLRQALQLYWAAADGSVVFRKKLSRHQLAAFMSESQRCVVPMEACSRSWPGARDWQAWLWGASYPTCLRWAVL